MKDLNFNIESLRPVIVPSLLFLGVILVYLVGGNILFRTLKNTQENLLQAKNQTDVLQQKLTILKANQIQVSQASNKVVQVLPNSNSTLLVSSQIRRAASDAGVTIRELQISPSTEDESSISIRIEANGLFNQINGFLTRLIKIAPIVKVSQISLDESGVQTSASIVARSYWADYPEVIPNINEPIEPLSSEEQFLLSTLDNLTYPEFQTGGTTIQVTPEAPSLREDPFNL